MWDDKWKIAFVILLSVLVGFLLAGGAGLPRAQAQIEGQASGVVALLGQERNGYAPLVLVDVPEQAILVYEYSYGEDRIQLTSARTFRFDKLLAEFNVKGPTVEEVRRAVSR